MIADALSRFDYWSGQILGRLFIVGLLAGLVAVFVHFARHGNDDENRKPHHDEGNTFY